MASVVVKELDDKQTWEGFVLARSEANFLQSWNWGEFYKRLDKKVYRSGFYANDKLVGVMLSVIEPAKRARYLTVPGGPIIDWDNSELIWAATEEIKRICRQEKCVFARVRPQITASESSTRLFKSLGFRPAQMHLHAELTSQLDITKDEDELRQNFRKNTRYELKKAKKRGINVSKTTDQESIDGFYELELETSRRHGFVPYSKKFLAEQFSVFAADDQVALYSANTASGELIAQAFVIFYGQEAAYHYGASTELGRSEPGAYLLQWEAIKEAKRRGMSRYNFWGVVKPEQTKHRFYGVSVFKRGFRGDDVEYLHAQDLVINWPKYLPNLLLEFVRRKRRHL